MTDIADELKQIKSILNVLYTKIERLEGQVAYCVDALMEDFDGDYEEDPLSQHDIGEFENNDDDNPPPPYSSISSSTTKDV